MSEDQNNIISEQNITSLKQNSLQQHRWYVVHTYSGYENKVKANIEKIIDNRNMHDLITEVIVPTREYIDYTKSGKEKIKFRMVFPGYVFLKMIMNDDTWYVVRNTRGVTSFVGPGSKPVPLTDSEVISMGIESFSTTCSISEGDIVLIKEGPFSNSTGVVKEVNVKRRTIIVNVNFFGRETPVELSFEQVQLIS